MAQPTLSKLNIRRRLITVEGMDIILIITLTLIIIITLIIVILIMIRPHMGVVVRVQ